MHSTFRSRSALLATLLAFVLAAVAPTTASAVPEPGANAKRGFRLFARSLGAMTINRIYCGLSSDGQICVDSTNSSTIGGGFWPKGTADQYVFNTGLQLAGIIGADGGPWAGDTTGAFFFDPKGTTQHGLEVRPIYNMNNPSDFAEVNADPNHPARVPSSPDPQAVVFQSLLQGRVSASQGDIWFMSWDGDPSFAAGRPHPLGVVVETRGLGWNFPAGNEDLLYYIYTFYNVSSLNRSDYEAQGIRPSMVDILVESAQEFHSRNNAAAGITLPTGGYTVDPLFAAFGTDMDVASAGTNWAGVILPFALGTTYDGEFDRFAGWTFDPAIFSKPFFAGSGFVGVKYLKSPTGAGEIQLYSNTENGGQFGDPQNTTQLYRYLSGQISVAAGDEPCNSGDPTLSKICYLNNSRHFDMRFYQSSTPLALAPGALGTIVVSYIFAAPVAVGGCVAGPCGDLAPGQQVVGNSPIHGNPQLMTSPGVPIVDSIAGYLGFNDANADGEVTQDEYLVVPGSLLGKSLTAQAIFDAQFLLPFAPDSPDFFLVPNDNQVTVLWRPTTSEANGDPFFSVASDPTNALYDPNYREFDVEGYRVYRGRVDAPNELQLIAQFDYTGTTIRDYAGQINPDVLCAPEIAITANCAVAFGPFTPGLPRIEFVEIPLVGEIVQVKLGERTALADGTAIVLVADTAVTGNNSGYPQLSDAGVPFVYVDNSVRSNFRYFYSVTAFDINSWQSGPSNLESARNTKAVVPRAPASNYENEATVISGIFGRDQLLDHTSPNPALDPVTGRFAGPFPASNAWEIGLAGFVKEVLSQPGALTARLDSIVLGSPYSGTPLPHQYWITADAGGAAVSLMLPITQPQEIGLQSASANLPSIQVDGTLASRYGGSAAYSLAGAMSMEMEGPDYHSLYGRGCVNGRRNFGGDRECAYNGSRWFDGPSPQNNETMADPISGNQFNFSGNPMTNYNNAGELTGVSLIHNTQAYQSVGGGEMRPAEGIRSGARRAADFNVYWGAGGTVDSVIDVTHNVPVPFAADHLAGTWGILNQSAALPSAGSYDQRDELTYTDLHCIAPMNQPGYNPGSANCSGGPTYTLSRTAIPGPVVPFSPSLSASRTDPVWPDAGFGIYLSGDFFTMAMAGGGVPAAGTVWSLRSYIGGIVGGNGDGGNYGPYIFNEDFNPPRSWTAVGTELRVQFDLTNKVNAASVNDLSKVHTVPDPYYVTNEFETTTVSKVIKFVNLPEQAIIRIYSSSGVLVALLEHNSTQFGGSEDWNVRNRNNQVVASGVYFYHIESGDARRVGRMTVVNFAQ